MSTPNLTIKVEPAEASSIVYGALAAETSNDPSNGQLSLVLTITNNEPSPVHVNQVTVSFVGPPNVGPSSIMADVTIPSTQTTQWYFEPANNIILPVPAPRAIKLGLSCDGFSDPAEVNMSLAQYQSPATGSGYSFPAQTDDLKRGEYWTGLSAAHGAAGGGTQLFAYDLWVRAYDPSANQWPTSLPGADVSKNENTTFGESRFTPWRTALLSNSRTACRPTRLRIFQCLRRTQSKAITSTFSTATT